jgi:hypothetical protein
MKMIIYICAQGHKCTMAVCGVSLRQRRRDAEADYGGLGGILAL